MSAGGLKSTKIKFLHLEERANLSWVIKNKEEAHICSVDIYEI